MRYTAAKTSTSKKVVGAVLTCSIEAIIITWLISGLLPCTLTAGIGSKDMNTNGPLVRLQQNNNNARSNENNSLINVTPSTSITEDVSGDISTNNYDCPKSCQCEYSSSSQKLEIRCSLLRSEDISSNQKIDLSSGIRTLRISHALLVDAKSVGNTIPLNIKNTLIELDLEQVTLEPKSFFSNSLLFRENSQSLRRISICRGNFRGGEESIADLPAADIRAVLKPFASLQSLDSLEICDSSPNLATIVLQAMPAVNLLRAVNNSLYDIPYESLTTNPHQYSAIKSIDFSKNHLSVLRNGLLEGLTELHTLDVSHNRITHLQEQVFTGLSALRKLNVSHNQIEYVDAEVFTPLQQIKLVDLSHNEVVQFFEPYFGNNKRLEVLNLSNMWVTGTFKSSETATRSLMEIESLIHSLHRVEKLDISANGMRIIPETLTHAPNLQQVVMDGNQWECSCQDRWFTYWVATAKVSIGDKNSLSPQEMWCYSRMDNLYSSGEIHKFPFHDYLKNLTRSCSNSNIDKRTPYKYHAIMGTNKQLYCHAQKPDWPKITWITPSKQRISSYTNSSDSAERSTSNGEPYQQRRKNLLEPHVSADGSLHLINVTGADYGLYLCIASYEDLDIKHYVHLGMDVSVFRDVRLMSIIVGWTFSFTFLLLVLLVQLIRYILDKLGVRCVTMATTKQTRRVRAFFDSMEQHKTSQLDWLRDNYNMQAKKIKDNCFSQLDRIRESYSTQSKNLGEIRDYGTQQLYTLRDQYNDQVRRVANYSAHQLCKVRENYVFKRNQVCKFSNHQLLRLRETYKWQAQTLNKILENLPRGLNFDTCRGMGACARTDSIYLDDFGEGLGCPHHRVHTDIYHLGSGFSHHHSLMGLKPEEVTLDKMEHVSLLIPPEFVNEYKQTAGSEGIEHHAVIEEERSDEELVEAEPTVAEGDKLTQCGLSPAENKTTVEKTAEIEEFVETNSSTSTIETNIASTSSATNDCLSSTNSPVVLPPDKINPITILTETERQTDYV